MAHAKYLPLEFAAYARALARGKDDLSVAAKIAADESFNFPRAANVIKAAVSVGTTSDSTWAGALVDYQQMAESFIDSIRGVSLFDSMYPYAKALPLRSRLAVATGAVGSPNSEGGAKAVTRFSFATDTMNLAKVSALIVASDDLLRFAHKQGLTLLNRELQGAVADATNAALLAFLRSGAGEAASSGSILEDLRTALKALASKGRGKVFAVCSPEVAIDLSTAEGSNGQKFPGFTATGGVIAGVQFIASPEANYDTSGHEIVVVDAGQMALGADVLTLDASRNAALQMADDPANGAANLVSMFQTNSTAWRAERWTSWAKIREAAAFVITGAEFNGSP
jgi:HK97 family phage major capsid protein